VVDTLGLPLAVVVHRGDLQDRDGAALVLARLKPLYCWLAALFADAACDHDRVAIVRLALRLSLIIVRRTEPGFVVLAKRWVVERTFAWLGRCRRLAKDYEHLTEVSEAFVKLALIRLMLQRLEHPPASSAS
jgi:transposase